MRWSLRRREPVPLQMPGVTTHPAAVGRASYPASPDRLWVADLGAAPTGSGTLYFAAVLDCYSRQCLGWSVAERLRPELVVRAVRLAAACRRPPEATGDEPQPVAGEIALALAPRCGAAEIAIPRGSSPSTIDGAVVASFISMVRRELTNSPAARTRTDAAQAIASWIANTYNSEWTGFVPAMAI